jgi:hypothetical protein
MHYLGTRVLHAGVKVVAPFFSIFAYLTYTWECCMQGALQQSVYTLAGQLDALLLHL